VGFLHLARHNSQQGNDASKGYSSFLKNDNRRAVGQRGDCCLSAGPHPVQPAFPREHNQGR
jgi:hypothetical protein